MSKLTKLKTGRNENLENSAFSLNVTCTFSEKFCIAYDNMWKMLISTGQKVNTSIVAF